jgi:hypothetical protein
MRTPVMRALRRAVLVSFAAPAVLGCGGMEIGSVEQSDGSSGSSSGSSEPSSSGSSASGNTKVSDPDRCALKSNDASANTGCGETFDLVGSSVECEGDASGYLPSARCDELCPSGQDVCRLFDDAYGGHLICLLYPCGMGRRPEGLLDCPVEGPDSTARFLARAAYLEAASVVAFERLTRELEAHGAPESLRAGSRAAVRDEIRHARITRALAEKAGARVPVDPVGSGGVRSLETIAIENAVEGCVRETFGAAVTVIQAARAGDARIRSAMKKIARDETKHAELSWRVARWLEEKLDVEARGRVRQARAAAVVALIHETSAKPDAAVAARLGVPSAAQARVVLDALSVSLWS